MLLREEALQKNSSQTVPRTLFDENIVAAIF